MRCVDWKKGNANVFAMFVSPKNKQTNKQTKQNKKQNKTKQNKKQNKTKQNKTKQKKKKQDKEYYECIKIKYDTNTNNFSLWANIKKNFLDTSMRLLCHFDEDAYENCYKLNYATCFKINRLYHI